MDDDWIIDDCKEMQTEMQTSKMSAAAPDAPSAQDLYKQLYHDKTQRPPRPWTCPTDVTLSKQWTVGDCKCGTLLRQIASALSTNQDSIDVSDRDDLQLAQLKGYGFKVLVHGDGSVSIALRTK